MSVSEGQQTEILQLFQGMFNASPGDYFYGEALRLVDSGIGVGQLAELLAGKNYGTGTLYLTCVLPWGRVVV